MKNLPHNFSRIENGHAGIICDLRYATTLNFVGEVIDKYQNNKITIASNPLIEKLLKAQEEFSKDGYNIVIYEAYRPLSASLHFSKWVLQKDQEANKPLFYPYLDKAVLFNGYISNKSAHTRGAAIDLSIIPKNKEYNDKPILEPRNIGNKKIIFINDNTLDMGSSFDLLDELSWTENKEISSEAQQNRHYLRNVMHKHGFHNYEKEWWHFSIKDEPFPKTYFDFPVA